ncbi:MAG: hypothetical protein ACE5KX_08000 [Acidimicrobiia bacterium]
MARVRELPDLIQDFINLAKAYVRQEALEPAKRLGRLALFSLVGVTLFAVALLLLAIAGMRALRDLLPDSQMWSGLGYVLSAVGLLLVTGGVVWRASR